VTPSCRTRYIASSSGQTLEALCGPDDLNEEVFRVIDSEESNFVGANWAEIGSGFLEAMSLNSGVRNLSSSYARTLTSLQLTQPELNPLLPSPAEALLSMVSCTALDLTSDFPFVMFWVRPFLRCVSC
jgi:hypothetical protein